MASSSYDARKAPQIMSQIKLVWAVLPHVPLIVRVALLHMLRLSEQSKYLDLRSELVVSVVRAFLSPQTPQTISATQELANRDPGIKGRLWVANYATPVPLETDVRNALVDAIEGLRDPAYPTEEAMRWPHVVSVEAEWTGYRAAATSDSRLPPISEKEKFDEMQKEVKSPVTVMYLHGGAYYLMDPCTYRPVTKKLAKLTGGRCYSVRYRLAPQNPFPAALLDAMVSYLTLLYPPEDAYHEPVWPEHLTLAGDSAGGNLSLALTQLLLELRRQGRKITWFGAERDVPLPAGVGVCSPWMDLLQTSPSWESNGRFDFLPTPNKLRATTYPACDAWPASPPRREFYADDALLAHPLATLLMARDWAGAPPTYICTGWELLADEDKYIAQKLQRQGVEVVFEEYEGMPHCFAIMLPNLDSAYRCFKSWAGFIKSAAETPRSLKSRALTVKAKTLDEVDIPFVSLSEMAEEEMRSRVLAEKTTAKL